MNVRVRLFAAVQQAAGGEWFETELDEPATIGQLRCRLVGEMPQVSSLLQQATFALDSQYAANSAEIPPGVEVACIPPVSGG
jgi:molybdopterin synthase catalytic subunit/molybdopterin synthase sulfur carrier subunit